MTTIANDTPTGESHINEAGEAPDEAVDNVQEATQTNGPELPTDLFAAVAPAASVAADAPTELVEPALESTPAEAAALAPIAYAEPADFLDPADAAEAPNKRSKKGLIWGLAGTAGLLAAGAWAASTILLAPNTSIAGVPVGWQMPGNAVAGVQDRVDNTVVTIQTPSGNFDVTGKELGATVNTDALIDTLNDSSRLGNFGAWEGNDYNIPVQIDPNRLEHAVVENQPEAFSAPQNANVTYNASTGKFVATPAVAGTGVDTSAVVTAITDALATGKSDVAVAVPAVTIPAQIGDAEANKVVSQLNTEYTDAGFYIDGELVVPVDAKVISSMLSVTPNAAGTGFDIKADAAPLNSIIATLPDTVNRPATAGTQVVNSSGTVLEVLQQGYDGRQVGDTSKLADEFVTQLTNPGATGAPKVDIPVQVTPAIMTNLEREIHVDLTNQMLYMMENGEVVDSWLVSTGRPWQATTTGTYPIVWKLVEQDMRGDYITVNGPVYEADGSVKQYLREDVQYPMYFNGDQAFHGVYWHSTWGTPNSAGCVGMPDWRAEQLWNWSPYGTEAVIYGQTPNRWA